jgi:hypothetical protein
MHNILRDASTQPRVYTPYSHAPSVFRHCIVTDSPPAESCIPYPNYPYYPYNPYPYYPYCPYYPFPYYPYYPYYPFPYYPYYHTVSAAGA